MLLLEVAKVTPGLVQWKFRQREDSMARRTEGVDTGEGNRFKNCVTHGSVSTMCPLLFPLQSSLIGMVLTIDTCFPVIKLGYCHVSEFIKCLLTMKTNSCFSLCLHI